MSEASASIESLGRVNPDSEEDPEGWTAARYFDLADEITKFAQRVQDRTVGQVFIEISGEDATFLGIVYVPRQPAADAAEPKLDEGGAVQPAVKNLERLDSGEQILFSKFDRYFCAFGGEERFPKGYLELLKGIASEQGFRDVPFELLFDSVKDFQVQSAANTEAYRVWVSLFHYP